MTKTISPLLRRMFVPMALAAALAAPMHAEARTPAGPVNRGVESTNQPVVQRTDFVFDAVADGYGLSAAEKGRIRQWLDAIDLRYGDRVAIADQGLEGRSGLATAVAHIVEDYGILLAGVAPRTAGEAPAGAVRIVVSRATASVPTCPNWRDRAEFDVQGGLSYDYGCAINGNLAAMIADPEDLVQGRRVNSDLRGATSSRAISAYNKGTASTPLPGLGR